MNLFDFDESRKNVYVLDTETTGLKLAPTDVVVDIGICEVNLPKGTVRDVYSEVVGYDVDSWNEYRRKAWIFDNSDITLDMVRKGKPFGKVRTEVMNLIGGRNVTSYNTDYDLRGFLYKEPWDLKGGFVECTDIMRAATTVCKLKSEYYDTYRFPKLDYAYGQILEGADPAGIHGRQEHRALSDARMASHLMIKMHRDGDYRL